MDVGSPEHLELLRDQPEFKTAGLFHRPEPETPQVRFERTAKHQDYWPAIEARAAELLAAGTVHELVESHTFYGRPCWLLTVSLKPGTKAPFGIAVAAADGAPLEHLQELLRKVTRFYWFGSYFFK